MTTVYVKRDGEGFRRQALEVVFHMPNILAEQGIKAIPVEMVYLDESVEIYYMTAAARRPYDADDPTRDDEASMP